METTLMGDLGRMEKNVETTIMGYIRRWKLLLYRRYIFGL